MTVVPHTHIRGIQSAQNAQPAQDSEDCSGRSGAASQAMTSPHHHTRTQPSYLNPAVQSIMYSVLYSKTAICCRPGGGTLTRQLGGYPAWPHASSHCALKPRQKTTLAHRQQESAISARQAASYLTVVTPYGAEFRSQGTERTYIQSIQCPAENH